MRLGLPTVAQLTAAATKDDYIEDAISHCSERSVDFRVEDIEKFIIAQRFPLAKPAPSAIDIAKIKSL